MMSKKTVAVIGEGITEKFYIDIHNELIANKGSLANAVKNAMSSVASKKRDKREYTYTEMHLLIEALGIK